jgi:glycosyltransferase involved in cell wall biosynthesis
MSIGGLRAVKLGGDATVRQRTRRLASRASAAVTAGLALSWYEFRMNWSLANRSQGVSDAILPKAPPAAEAGAAPAARPAGKPVWALVIPWDTAEPGGVSQVVINLAEALRDNGRYEPVVIVLDWRATGRVEMRDGIRHLFIGLRTPDPSGIGRLGRMRYAALGWFEARRFQHLLRVLDARVVNFHYPGPAAEYLLKSRERARYSILFSLHGLDILESVRKGPAERARYIRMLAEGDAVVVVSHAFAALVSDLAPELAGRTRVVHNGVTPRRLRAGQPPDIALPRRYILNVATFEAKKGQKHLIEAFARLAASDPDLHLVIAGRPEGALPPLVEQIRALGLEDRVLLLRNVPHAQIGSLFASASLFCLSSLAEPFGIVLLEAGLFGLPVVATRVGGVPEIVRNGENGILVEAGDGAALAEAMRRLLDHPEEAAALADRLRRRVLAEFRWPASVARYVALAEQVDPVAAAARLKPAG